MTKIMKGQYPCLLINKIISDQETLDEFSNNKLEFRLRNTEKLTNYNMKKKLKNRVRLLINHLYPLDKKLVEELMKCQNNQLNSLLHLIRDLYICENGFLMKVFLIMGISLFVLSFAYEDTIR